MKEGPKYVEVGAHDAADRLHWNVVPNCRRSRPVHAPHAHVGPEVSAVPGSRELRVVLQPGCRPRITLGAKVHFALKRDVTVNFVDCGNGGEGASSLARNPVTTLKGSDVFAIGASSSISEHIVATVSNEKATQFQSRQQSAVQSLAVLFAAIATCSNDPPGFLLVPRGSRVAAASHASSTAGGGCGPGICGGDVAR